MTDTVCRRATSQRAMSPSRGKNINLKRKLAWDVFRAFWETVGAPADAARVTLSHFTITWVASATALILKDYPGQGHYTEHRLAPFSLLPLRIIPASSSVISLGHHLCMLFRGYYLQGSECYRYRAPSFTSPAGGKHSLVDK